MYFFVRTLNSFKFLKSQKKLNSLKISFLLFDEIIGLKFYKGTLNKKKLPKNESNQDHEAVKCI